eukprot:Skav236676  [mRNA]  locus=scaffold406:7385:16934:- [translate_table: standard]
MASVPALAASSVSGTGRSAPVMAIYDPLICRMPSGRSQSFMAAAATLAVSFQKHAQRHGRPVPNGVSCSSSMLRKAHSHDGNIEGERTEWSLKLPRVQILALLLLACVANQACRALPFYLVDFGDPTQVGRAMNQDLGFTSADYGFFATLGFTVPFTLASLWAGVTADRVDRFRLTAAAGLGWPGPCRCARVAWHWSAPSVVYCCCAFCWGSPRRSGEPGAATNPAALSLIAELFPDATGTSEQQLVGCLHLVAEASMTARATANAIFGLGIYLGGACASMGAFVDEQEPRMRRVESRW